jgi:iron(III) transport system substrate-binding protein
MGTSPKPAALASIVVTLSLAVGCAEESAGGADTAAEPLTVYSGREEELVGSVIDDFTEETGIGVEVRYGDTAELAATIVNEGEASPADVFWAQDAGALGALEDEELFAALPMDVLDVVDPRFRSEEGEWVGVTGRSRVMAYNTEALSEAEVPDSVFDLTNPRWDGRVGWAPTNGSFQAFVTAMRELEGEEDTRTWLEGMLANGVQHYSENTLILEALGRGEIDLGLTNHYYLYRYLAEDPDFPVANAYPDGDVGALLNVAGVGVLASSDQSESAEGFVEYLLSEAVQSFFGKVTDELEYPLREGVTAEKLPPLEELDPPDIDLSDLEDLQGTLDLLREVGALE